MMLWLIGLIILAVLTVVACALAIGSDADDSADATLDKLRDCEND